MKIDASNPEKGQETSELPTVNVNGTNSSTQPSAETTLIPTEMLLVTLFEWSHFFNAEIIVILTKADEIIIFFVATLQLENLSQIRG